MHPRCEERSFLRWLKKRIHLSPGSRYSATAIFSATAAVIGFSHLSARFTPFRRIHSALLVEFLIARGESERLLAVHTLNLFIFHLLLSQLMSSGSRLFLSRVSLLVSDSQQPRLVGAFPAIALLRGHVGAMAAAVAVDSLRRCVRYIFDLATPRTGLKVSHCRPPFFRVAFFAGLVSASVAA